MKIAKKILKITAIVLVSVMALMIASAYLFSGKIKTLVKTEINKNLNAKVDFGAVDISLFRHFPRVSLGLDDLQITGVAPFENDTLLFAKRLDAAVDIMSFVRGKEMNIYSIFVSEPRVRALVNEDGLANWDIVKPDTAKADQSASKPFHLKLKKYEIDGAYIFYNDAQSKMSAEIYNLNHSGTGDFESDLFTLVTTTRAASVTYIYEGIPFINKAKADVDADLKIDNTTATYSFENVNVLLNAMKITGSGFIRFLDDESYDMDIKFKTPDTDFKNLLSLLPAVYKNDFDKLTAGGTASFDGSVKGIYSDTSIPGYHVSMIVKDGAFKYADLPGSINQINLNATVDNPDGVTDNTVVDISQASLLMDKDPFNFRLLLKHPLTAMFVDAAAKGRLNLNRIGQFVKFEEGTRIAGQLNADVSVKGNVNELEKQQYQNFYAAGNIDLSGFNYLSRDFPDGIKIDALSTRFSPSSVEISKLSGRYLKTGFSGSGYINNLLNYMLSDKPLSANLTLNADSVNLNSWMGVSSDTTTSQLSEPFKVPANLDVVLHSKVNQINYDKLDIRNLSGSLTIGDQTVKLNNVRGDALGGSMVINGSYSTRATKEYPAISMSYNVEQVDIQKTFLALNTVQKLMPISKFLSGKITSSLSVNGRLGQNMDLDISSLNGAGNLLLIEGVLSQFAPLEKIASTLNVTQLKSISMKDIKAFFEFANGKMLVKPFTVKVNGIEMEIGGLQGFDESIDYAVNMKLPRAFLGAQGNQLVNNLASAVTSKGIPVTLGETINLKLNLGGTINNPTIKTDLKQTGESLAAQMTSQAKDFAEAKIESAKAAIADSVSSVKKQLTDAAKETLKDELKKQLLGQKDTTTTAADGKKSVDENVKESAKGLLKGILNNKKKDTTKNQ